MTHKQLVALLATIIHVYESSRGHVNLYTSIKTAKEIIAQVDKAIDDKT
jgi:hypothetical protein